LGFKKGAFEPVKIDIPGDYNIEYLIFTFVFMIKTSGG